MGELLQRLVDEAGPVGWVWWCPGCKHPHVFNVEQPTKPHPETNYPGGYQWSFNGNHEAPTFTPSLVISSGGWKRPDGSEVPKIVLCHSIVTNGQVTFCGDCRHDLVGKTVPMEPYEDQWMPPAVPPPPSVIDIVLTEVLAIQATPVDVPPIRRD